MSNVAQNAYINATILNARGHDCDVFAPDLYHGASVPEWYELSQSDVDISKLGNDTNFPGFYSMGREMPRIADWFAIGPYFIALYYLVLRRCRDPRAHAGLATLAYHRFKATIQRNAQTFACAWSDEEFRGHLEGYDLNPYLQRRIAAGRQSERIFERVRTYLRKWMPEEEVRSLTPPWSIGSLDGYFARDPGLEGFVRGLRATGLSQVVGLEFPGDLGCMPHVAAEGFTASQVVDWTWFGRTWRELVAYYDVCIFYHDSTRFAYCAGVEPYCSLEHGTIRAMPFEPTIAGRLLKRGYEHSARVFLTNTDYTTAKPRIEFRPDQAVYSIHPFDERPAFRFREGYVRTPDPAKIVFFCPARQDWVSDDPKMAKGNNRYFEAATILRDRGYANFRFLCVDHGIDCEASRKLIEELAIEEHVAWTPVLSKRRLWAAMLDAHAVIDQFMVSAFGGIAFEAFALGCRIISRDDGANNGAFFADAPPLLAAQTPEEIAERMANVIDDPDDAGGLGSRGIAWVQKYHSAERIYQLQLKAFADLPACGILPFEQFA